MAFDDKKLGTLFPTRHGEIIGTGPERVMLEATNGAANIKKRFQNNPDGSVTMLQTRNGWPEFTTIGIQYSTVCMLGMDSGVVDLTSCGFFLDEHSNDQGLLLRTTFVDSYASDVEPIVDVIYPPEVVGVFPPDPSPANSFPQGGYTRKRMAQVCPVSIFTGRTRLYVQSLYGRHNDNGNVVISEYTSTPSILVGPQQIEIHTSCGVYFDPVTAKHYMISVRVDGAIVYPLVAASCAEKLRPLLLDSAITIENKERIEAYILAYSTPSTANAQRLTLTSRNPSAMGYGWHFNWDGDKCDIVTVDIVDNGAGGVENKSTHYRLTFSQTDGSFSVSQTTVEGPTLWSNPRDRHVILSPVWPLFSLEKTGQGLGAYGGNAPYYVFYNKNELKVCRYSSIVTGFVKGAARSPSYLNPGAYNVAIGTDAVDYRYYTAWSGSVTTLSCGSESYSVRSGSHLEHGYIRSACTFSGAIPTTGWTRPGFATVGTTDQPTGYPGTIPHSVINDTYEGLIDVSNGNPGTDFATTPYTWPDPPIYKTKYTRANWPTMVHTETFDSYVVEYGYVIAVIPFYDAEAVYMLYTHSETKTETGNYGDREIDSSFFVAYGEGPDGGTYPDSLIGHATNMGTDNLTGVTTPFSRDIGPTIVTESKLVCNAGTFTGVAFPQTGQCFDSAYLLVDADYETRSSAHGTAVYAPDNGVASGLLPANLAGLPFSFVGWA